MKSGLCVGVTSTIGAANPVQTGYGYDAVDQLTSEGNNDVPALNNTFTYDPMGNRGAWSVLLESTRCIVLPSNSISGVPGSKLG